MLLAFAVKVSSQSVTLSRVFGTGSLVCSGSNHQELYEASYSGGGPNTLCNGSNTRLVFKVYGGTFDVNGSTSYTINNSNYGALWVEWDNQSTCPVVRSLTVTAYGVDPNNINIVNTCATKTLDQKLGGEWNVLVTGDNYIENYGSYTYTVQPACGATGYNWTVPASWQILSQNSNTITVSIQQGDQPGIVYCTPVTTNWLCPQTAQLNVTFSNCLGLVEGEYDPQQIENKIATGDFDNDGKEDDIVAFYDYTNFSTAMHVWLSDGTKFNYQGDNGWWYGNSFDASRVLDVVTGDFDNDGYRDDVAATYDWFNTYRIYIWTSNGSSFTALNQWYSSSTFTPSLTEHRVVSGDFDHDNYVDDIMMFYDNPTTFCNMYLWTSNGSGFSAPSIAMTNFNFDGGNLTGKVVSGDFDNDGWLDDIAGFYRNSTFNTSLYVWTCPGSCQRNSWWWSGTYASDMLTGNVVSGDFDKDGKHDDIAAFYYYGNWETRAHVFLGNNGSFVYQGDNGWWLSTTYDDQNNNRIKYRVVSGEFAQTGLYRATKYYDIAALVDNPCYSSYLHVWKSSGTALNYQGDLGWWGVCDKCQSGRYAPLADQSESETESSIINNRAKELLLQVVPNPNNGIFMIKSGIEVSNVTVDVYNVIGELVVSKECPVLNRETVDLRDLTNGIYFVYIHNSEINETHKIIKQ